MGRMGGLYHAGIRAARNFGFAILDFEFLSRRHGGTERNGVVWQTDENGFRDFPVPLCLRERKPSVLFAFIRVYSRITQNRSAKEFLFQPLMNANAREWEDRFLSVLKNQT